MNFDVKKHTKVMLLLILILTVSLSSCGKNDDLKSGKYYLSTDNGFDKSSYIEVLDKDTLELYNIDSEAYIDEETKTYQENDFTVATPILNNGEPIVLKDAPPDLIMQYKELMKTAYEGKKKISLTASGDVYEVFVEGGTVAFCSYIPALNKIELIGQSFILGE
jgi:uncharacterized lipoprotein YehR (DUF1307 family)